MVVQIGSARIDENGKTKGGKAGDQTGREVGLQNYYNHSKGWVCLRPHNPNHAYKLAQAMRQACANEFIGYDQNQRNTLITQLKAVGTIDRVVVPVECDCSSLVRACILQATGKDVGNFNTATERNTLLNSKLFYEVQYVWSSELRLGDVLVTKTKGHTVIVTYAQIREQNLGTAKVTAHSLNVRDGASTNCRIIGWLHKGQTVTIYEYNGDWARIGEDKWCSAKYLE